MAEPGDEALEKLRSQLADSWVRVKDVFEKWDEDGSGKLNRTEWCQVVGAIGGLTKAEADAIFNQLDKDGEGSIDFRELNHALRQGASVELDATLQAGAVEIQTGTENKFALRKGIQKTHSRALGSISLEMGPGDSIAEQIRNALAGSWSTVRSLWVEWDEDDSGSIDQKEFFRALTLLGLTCTRAESNELFDSFDADKSGSVEFHELQKMLRSSSSVELDAVLRAGALGEIEVGAKNKIATRKNGPGKTGSNVLSGVQLQSGTVSVVEQLRAALSANLGRVIDLFREWDEDSSGTIDKREFSKALQTLGFQASKAEYDKFFDSLDDDNSGSIDFGELHSKLRRGGASTVAASGPLPRHLRGPVSTRDTVLQALPRLGPRLLQALNEASANEELESVNEAELGTVSEKQFVSAINLMENGLHAQIKNVSSKKLSEVLRGLFNELAARYANEQQPAAAGPRLHVRPMLSHLRALLKEGDPSASGNMAARGAAAMAASGKPMMNLDLGAPSDVRVIFCAAVRSGLAAQVLKSWDVDEIGLIGKEGFRRALPVLHIAVKQKEADSIFDQMDTQGKGLLAYSELHTVVHLLESSRARVLAPAKKSSRKSKKTPRRKPLPATAKSQYVTELIDTLGAAYFIPATAPATGLKYSPRVHERVRPPAEEEIRLPTISPRKNVSAAVVGHDGITREITTVSERVPAPPGDKPSPRSLGNSPRKATKKRKAANGESVDDTEEERSLPVVSPRHAKLVITAGGKASEGGESSIGGPLKLPEQVPWCPAGRRKEVPLYQTHDGNKIVAGTDAALTPHAPHPPSQGHATDAATAARELAARESRELAARERDARNRAIERVRLRKAQDKIQELEKRLQELAPGEELPPPPFMSGGRQVMPTAGAHSVSRQSSVKAL